jgi:hypothetical protein
MILAWLSSCDILSLAVASAAKRKVQCKKAFHDTDGATDTVVHKPS